MEIYLDNSATTRVYHEVVSLMNKIMLEDYANPSSVHLKGLEAEKYVKESKENIAGMLKVKEKEIFFTSGGTESDNLSLIGTAFANQRKGKHLITTKIEHPAILNTVKYLKEQGFEIDYLSVNEFGIISLEELSSLIREDTILVSIMHTNNEVGALEPISEAGKLIKEKNPDCLFHVDAVQGFTKAEIYPKKQNVDLLSISGHKIHGPKGIGILYVNENVKIKPISYGGGQQKGLRSGTLNTPGIAGIGLAAKLAERNLKENISRLYELKSYFLEKAVKLKNVEIKVNGCPLNEEGKFDVEKTAPHIINISVPGLRSEVLLHALEERGIYVSAGSACASHSKKESSTLKAMGKDAGIMDSALRLSMSEFTTGDELDTVLNTLEEIVPYYSRFIRK